MEGGHPHHAIFSDSVLVSNKNGVLMKCQAARLIVSNCVLVAMADAVKFDFNPVANVAIDVQCHLNHSTIAAGAASFHGGDFDGLKPAPAGIVANANVFLAPFVERHGGLFLLEKQALSHGLFYWQGRHNMYDRRLGYYASSGGAPDQRASQPYSAWSALWGSNGDLEPILELSSAGSIVRDRSLISQLDRLALLHSAPFAENEKPGADLVRLGILKKPGK
jgi:hypothetical protein